ncbi:MAG TPA: GNAT family N-acetyltransferase [Thermoleophilia bacterium]|nr:GNAT family N-acetyltransferase [Thermoleophilia bacterium]HQG04580.1 GNAT family N-acetyltransferase [Thermoleophilia bacterium]HQJ97805.1 GNAT family N-acetyltransferase [Thermoleophilia bacterium]
MDDALPAGFEVRRARPDDAAAVAALVAASQEAFQGQAEISSASVLRKWRAPHFDLERDAWLVQTDDGRVIAFGAVRETGPGGEFEGNFTVHPAYYGHGIAAYILGRLEERVCTAVAARGQGAAVLQTWTGSDNPAERDLLRRSGYRQIAVFSRMEKDLRDELEDPVWPSGVGPRPFRPGRDDLAVYTVLVEAFGEDDENLGDPEEWSRDVVDDPRADPDLWLLACAGEEVVGVAIDSLSGERGFIERLAVRPAWQGRGIGGALLREAFALLRRRGATRAVLAVELDVAVEALDLYRRAGMTEARRIEFYEKRIAPAMDV